MSRKTNRDRGKIAADQIHTGLARIETSPESAEVAIEHIREWIAECDEDDPDDRRDVALYRAILEWAEGHAAKEGE